MSSINKMKNPVTLILLCIIFLLCMSTTPVNAQRRADKEYELKAFSRAVQSYLRYINENPASGSSMANLADCYRHLNEMEEAEQWYERAFSAPQQVDPIHYLYYGEVLMAVGKYDLAAREFRRYSQINSFVGNHYYEKAIYASRNGNRKARFTVQPMDGLNTSSSDFGPTFFKGSNLIYASARLDVGKDNSASWSGRANNQLFLAQPKTATGGLEPIGLVRPQATNSRYSEGPVSYSFDGKTVVITRNDIVDGVRHISSSGMKLDLFIGKVGINGNWSEEEAFPWNGADFSTGFGHLAADGNTLYFASNRPGGVGGFDIYVSYRTGTGNSWSPPELLDDTVNTPGDEITPYFDGRTLYFASDWHDGYGGYDIFRSERENQQWSVSRNMGVGINSSRDDFGFIFDGIQNTGYFVSNRKPGKGSEDIYKVSRETNEVIVRVINATDNQPIASATIDFSDCQKGIYETDNNGIFNFRADEELNCRLLIRKQGYISTSLQLSGISNSNNKNYEIQLLREGEQYIGRVVDVDTRAPLSDVMVTAINQQNRQVTEALTSEDGTYSLPLQKRGNYIIRYSKVGYSNRDRTLSVREGDRAVLGTIEIKKTSSTTPLENETISTPYIPTPVTNLPSVGYAVQVGAAGKLELDKYASLNVHGNVYYVKEDNLHKIRIGVYLSKTEANTIAQKLKAEGYKGAFVVEESMQNVADKVVLKDRAGLEIGNSSPTNQPSYTSTSTDGYKVQLAAYTDPERYFDESKVEGMGFLEKRKRGQLTIMLLGGYKTEQEARTALARAKRAGFTTAFLVYEENGNIKKVN